MKSHSYIVVKEEVHIWKVNVKDSSPLSSDFLSTLTFAEQQRAQRLLDPLQAQCYLLKQVALRHILSSYLKLEPKLIIFENDALGKPFIVGFDLQFNVSHSKHCALIAVSLRGPVGVDIEFLQSDRSFDDLVRRFFSSEEQEEYFRTSQSDRCISFYRAWTRKEAYLKAIGLGLSYPLDAFAVSLLPNKTQALIRVGEDTVACLKWRLHSFSIDECYLASLATQCTIEPKLYTWSF